ncbi:MAG: hypothetical protein JWM33_3373, partial [Caulobacteraceae bacterium]|nr:hypothetical protein [Caulobacteraceae bacterium]
MGFISRLAAAVIILLALPGMAQAKWLRGESAHFIIYSDGGETSLRDYASRLEDLDYAMHVVTGLDPKAPPPVRKLPVFMVRGAAQLKEVWPDADKNIGGFYSANTRDIFDVSIKKDTAVGGSLTANEDNSDLIMYHEYTHHFMYQYFAGAYPTWLSEGFAEYFGATTIDNTTIKIGRALQRDIDPHGEWLPLSTLLTKGVFEIPTDKREDYYIAAWALTHYLKSGSAGPHPLNDYLAGLAAGQDSLTAMQKATGEDIATLQRKMIAYMGGEIHYVALPRPKHQPGEVTITTLPTSADTLLLKRQQLSQQLNPDTRKALLESIRAEAGKYPTDRFAQLTLARAEIEEGDRLAGEKVLAPLLAAQPNDPEVNELMGLSLARALDEGGTMMSPAQRQQAITTAQAYLSVPIKADPADYQALIAYAGTAHMSPGYPTET